MHQQEPMAAMQVNNGMQQGMVPSDYPEDQGSAVNQVQTPDVYQQKPPPQQRSKVQMILMICGAVTILLSFLWMWQGIRPPSVGYKYRTVYDEVPNKKSGGTLSEYSDSENEIESKVHINRAAFRWMSLVVMFLSWAGGALLIYGFFVRASFVKKINYIAYIGVSALQIVLLICLAVLFLCFVLAAYGTLDDSKDVYTDGPCTIWSCGMGSVQMTIVSNFAFMYDECLISGTHLCEEKNKKEFARNPALYAEMPDRWEALSKLARGSGIFFMLFCVIGIVCNIGLICAVVIAILKNKNQPIPVNTEGQVNY